MGSIWRKWIYSPVIRKGISLIYEQPNNWMKKKKLIEGIETTNPLYVDHLNWEKLLSDNVFFII